ncbi:MAG TPA: PilZ domain-containing protein [Candidatus Sulfotelmatobacter sp.]|nr:PilZ domain-containing protein [Candidatus Sulfotelmatobacter sp.]
MSAQGSAPRATLDLKVKVWGMGANGQPFFQNAMAQNISATGACLYGIEPELKVGDVIGVQYEGKKARCKVVWMVDAGALKKTQVGVQLVLEQDCPWAAALPTGMKSEERMEQRQDNRRKFARHKISYPVELRDERVNTPLRVNATDISGNGCYVETVMPLAVATSLRVDLWIDDDRLTPSAVVRTRDPGVGMGIEFTGLTEEQKKRFQAHLEKLDPGTISLGPKTTSQQEQ